MSQLANIPSDELPLVNVLCDTIYPGASVESASMVIEYCKAAGLDPVQKPVHIVPMSVKDTKTGKNIWRDVVMPGIGLYRIQASRSAGYAGISEPEFGADITENLGGVEVTYPNFCIVRVKRRLGTGEIAEFSSKEFWKENYASKKGSAAPNAMWLKRSYGQLAKCAEAQALRKAFPETVSAAPVAEEMEGKMIEVNPLNKPKTQSTKVSKITTFIQNNSAEQAGDIEPTQKQGVTCGELLGKIQQAKTVEALAILASELSQCDDSTKTELRAAYKVKHDELKGNKS